MRKVCLQHVIRILGCIGIMLILWYLPCKVMADGPDSDIRLNLLNSMQTELDRSMLKLSMEGFEKPYFISYAVSEKHTIDMKAKFGSLYSNSTTASRRVFAEVRVGDHKLDNTELSSREFQYSGRPKISGASYWLPLDENEDAVRQVLWYVTDATYKKALEDYLKKKAEQITDVKQEDINDFSIEEPGEYIGPQRNIELEREKWVSILKMESAYMADIAELITSNIHLSIQKEVWYYVNSEGSKIIEEKIYYYLTASAHTKAQDGMGLRNYVNYAWRKSGELPAQAEFHADIESMIGELIALRTAEEGKPYSGPAILDPSVTGVIFHEAIGHRLEGERQKRERSGQTFKDKVNTKIIPPFFNVIDDPTLVHFNEQTLFGYYAYDNEGIPAQRAVLIDRGILKNYLMSRTPIKGFLHSNGHGRSDGSPYNAKPMGRMGTLIIESVEITAQETLKKMLLQECKKQGKTFGYIIKKAVSGETATGRHGFQAFRQRPILLYQVRADTGEEILVRGLEIVGTPLSSINKILAASDNYNIFNGYCGAESGYIPVSTIAPSVLTTEIELQKISSDKSKPPLLPAPQFENTEY